MKNFTLDQMHFESLDWKNSLFFNTSELTNLVNRMVDVLKNTNHMFIIEKVEQFQHMIIVQDGICRKMTASIDAHEFRILNIGMEINNVLLNELILQHQAYRNENQHIQLSVAALKMEFNSFFVDQLNSIAEHTFSTN